MKDFKKSDLKTGMRAELRNGDTFLVFKGVNTDYSKDVDFLVGISKVDTWHNLSLNYTEDLMYNGVLSNINDIIKVYSCHHPYSLLGRNDGEYKGKLLWERKEEVEYKDGDVIVWHGAYGKMISILKSSKRFNAHVCFCCKDNDLIFNGGFCKDAISHIATEEEQQLLFDELKKQKGLKWDADKKELVKIEKPFLELDGVEYSESTLRSLIKKATNN